MQSQNLSRGAIAGGGAVSHNVVDNPQGSAFYRVLAQIPDLVNGDVATMEFIFVGAGLAAEYHWLDDRFTANLPAITSDATAKARVIAEATVLSWDLSHGPRAMDPDKARFIALVIAAGRCAVRRAWGVATVDVIATQLKTPVTAANALCRVTNANVLSADIAGGPTVVEFAAELAAVDAVYELHKDGHMCEATQAAVGMPVCNGCVMVMTLVHHYVEPHKQVCDAVVDQHCVSIKDLPGTVSVEEYRDALCHKTCHPIKSNILVGLARNGDVVDRLNSLGHGSATVRLPAEFAPEKAAGAIATVVQKASQAGKESNVSVSTVSVLAMEALVRKTITDKPGQAGIKEATEIVSEFERANSVDIAWCAGFLNKMLTESQASERAKSIMGAKSIERMSDEDSPAFAAGAEHYMEAAKWRRTRARDGHLAGHGLMGADQPEAFVDPALLVKAKLEAEYGSGKGASK